MKASERHHLKQNEFAQTAARVATSVTENRDRLVLYIVIAAVVVAAVGGFAYWRYRVAQQAGMALGDAMAIAQAPIVPAPTLPGATQAAGTYPTEQARADAALQAFQRVASTFPGSQVGMAAEYHAAASLLAMGKAAEAETAFAAVTGNAGSALYAPMAKLGQAEAQIAQGKYDAAIALLNTLVADRDGIVPVDGVLMKLGQASARAGKTNEAKAAYKRVVDEFPQSVFASEARQQLALIG